MLPVTLSTQFTNPNIKHPLSSGQSSSGIFSTGSDVTVLVVALVGDPVATVVVLGLWVESIEEVVDTCEVGWLVGFLVDSVGESVESSVVG